MLSAITCIFIMMEKYTAPDLHAPRFRPEVFDILNGWRAPFYKELKTKHPELAVYTDVQIKQIIRTFNERIAIEVINNRNGVRLAEGLGIIVTGACKVSEKTAKNNTDQKTSHELGVKVPHQNLHTDKYVFKIKYTNELERYMFPNNKLWCFDAGRDLTRTIAAEFKKENGWQKYIVFTTKQHISHLFRKNKLRVIDNSAAKQNLENHDEFAF